MYDEKKIIVPAHATIDLTHYSTDYTGEFQHKKETKAMRKDNLKKMKELQDKMYAFDHYSLLLIFQAMDAGGKDSTIRHVMSGVNPQGCQVFSFKQPSQNELEHDYLWRTYRSLPERGRIGIFNRSYYEEVLTTRVHPEYIVKQRIPGIQQPGDITEDFWQQRYQSINQMEEHLCHNGTVIMKFFLHVSKEEQKHRFLKRIHRPDKNWKFTLNDLSERAYWEEYQTAFEKMLNRTSTEYAPWYVIPADHKWFMRTLVGDLIVGKLNSLDLHYPKVSKQQAEEIEKARIILESDT